MRLLLINPAERRTVQANLPAEIEAVRGANPPISLLEVAAAAREWAGAEVRLIDAHAAGLTAQQVAAQAVEWRPDLVGITAVSFTMLDVLDQVAAIKYALPDTPVWLGGLQPFLYPVETLLLPGVNGLVLGEGEHPLAELLKHFGDADALRDVPGLRFWHGDEIIDTGPAAVIADLDTLPQPAYDLLDAQLYSSVLTDAHPVAIAVTSRGCPYRCTFCSRSVTGKRFRAHSAEFVVDTFMQLKAQGYAAVLVYDEVFTVDKKRVYDVCAGLRAKNFDRPWMVRATVNSVDAEMLAELARSGCEWITFGIEAGSERVLERLNKPVSLEKAAEVFAAAHRAGLKTLAYFMVGNPEETAAEVAATERFMLRLDPDMVHAAVYTVYPATDLYEEGLQKNLFGGDVWRAFANDPSPEFDPPLWPGPLSPAERFAAVRRLYRRFYLRPRRILRELKTLTSWRALRNRLRYGWTLLGKGFK
ncbi:MAG: B12-binding domain-containing radical SAM protein [Alphaproteobacteria bacterium]